ncbi:MAG: 3',5'-cyclic-AMP phosphodiesterase [Methylococcaceae bacterium]|nr:3',5'-cyclic-AMP phosphodiesterase [Methylococcaceae bacterium]
MSMPTKPFSILQISDLHVLPETGDTLLGIDTEYYFKQVIAAAHERYGKFDLILVSGDLAQQPCIASYQRIHKVLASYKTKIVCLPGNHDNYGLMSFILNRDNISCDKQILLEDWQIICLNTQIAESPCGRLAQKELDFLVRCLEQHSKPNVIVAMHHHCIPSESEWLDTMLIENSGELFECLSQYKEVKLILNSHVHQVMEVQKQGIQVLTTPACCFQFKPNCKDFTLDPIPPGYRALQLYADGQFKSTVHRLEINQDELHITSEGYK